MAEYGRSRSTTASQERVWQVWSDPSSWPRWNPDVESVTLHRGVADGSTGEMRTKSGGRHDIRIEDVAQGRAFTLNSSGVPWTRLRFRCEVVPAEGGSKISQAVSMRGPMAWLFGPMMGSRIAQSFPALLDGLARECEQT